jgi:Ca-activated chloride channel homolog
MQFEHPYLLWLLLVAVPLLLVFFWWAARAKSRLIAQFISTRLLANLMVGVSRTRQKVRVALIVTAVGLLLIALARPQIGFTWEEARSRGLDIVVAIDTSKSMLAADVTPNRLRRAQLAAMDLKRLARADRLGLVAFAGSAFLQCPLTLDDEAFRQSVEALDVNIIPQGGTALTEALATAKSAFKEESDSHKVVVLFTDGEDTEGNPLDAAKSASKDGMRIFTVGVGTANGELLRITDTQGRTEFIKDPEGNAVKSRLNETLLRDMARETGGFFMLLSGANTMDLLYERGLAPLPKSDLSSQRVKRHHERYQWLLGMAIVLLLAEMLLPERKTVRQPMKSGPLAQPAKAGAVALMGIMLLGSASISSAASGNGLGNAVKRVFSKADWSVEDYERSLKKKPDDSRLHYNAGTLAFENKDYEQSLSHLNSALMAPDVPLQQRAYYNLGNTQYRMGEGEQDPRKKQELWEQAVKSYESACKLDPKDGDAEFNRELVRRKLEELKQQQQQQDKGDKNDEKDQNDKNEQKDPSKQDQQQSKDQQSKDQQSKEDQKKEEQKQADQQQQNQKSEEQQKKEQQDQASGQEKKDGEEKKGQQASQKQEKGDEQQDGEPQPQGATALRMTPQQAIRLLEGLKGEEKAMPFRPVLKTNRHDRIFKDW